MKMRSVMLPVLLGLLLFSSTGYGRYIEDYGQTLPEVYMNASQIIQYNGYTFEEHWVTTDDGYILYLLRIPPGQNANSSLYKPNEKRPVTLIQHGLVTSCDMFLLSPKDQNLPFVLADKGVDVWLGNNRGSRYSQNHTTLDPKSLEFWDFSWDQMVDLDLPKMIEYIVTETESEQIYYTAISQGTAIGFAKFSEDEKLASRIKHFLAFSPISRVGHCTSALRDLIPFQRPIKFFCNRLEHGKFALPIPIQQKIAVDVCRGTGDILCENILFALLGADAKELNTSRLAVIQAHNPDSTAVNVLIQWAQNVEANNFQRFDFGSKALNQQHYKKDTPPSYEPKNMNVPVSLFRGGRDALADPEDVSWLRQQLHTIVNDINIPYYNHMDTISAINAKDLTFPTAIKIITKDRFNED